MRGMSILKKFPILFLPLLFACTSSSPPGNIDQVLEKALGNRESGSSSHRLQKIGFTIQVGAFSSQDNAVKMENLLRRQGIDAYSFLHESGLYKVRFGNHENHATARRQALGLRQRGQIDDFFIVGPTDHSPSRIGRTGQGDLRTELVSTANRFLGVPYRWGGESARDGFDCSGLTMVVYRLNGLNLPRNSAWQYDHGSPVGRKELRRGDLVFFATNGGRRVSHVGMYIGDDRFIHAPRPGREVSVAKLSNSYFRERFLGGRTYL